MKQWSLSILNQFNYRWWERHIRRGGISWWSDLRVQAVNSSLHLGRHGSFLKFELSWVHHGPVKTTHRSQESGESSAANIYVNVRMFAFTVEWTNSSLLCPDSHAGSRQWDKGQTCVLSPCPVLILTRPGPPSLDPPRWEHIHWCSHLYVNMIPD